MSTFSTSNSHPQTLVAAARTLLLRPDPTTKGLWPRSAALLTRQALEEALDAIWRARAPGLERCSVRAQLLALPSYLGQKGELARRVAYAWSGLSRATHHHAYELPPTAVELEGWIETVEELVAAVAG